MAWKVVNPNLRDSGGALLLGCVAPSGYDEGAALSLVREDQRLIFVAILEKTPLPWGAFRALKFPYQAHLVIVNLLLIYGGRQ